MEEQKRRWGPGAEAYTRTPTQVPAAARGHKPSSVEIREQRRWTGITWDISAVDLSQVGGTGDPDRARHRFRSRLPDLIWDAARLEGNTFTLPEVRTLLEGVTVQGRPLQDQDQILALNEGFNTVDALVGDGRFSLSKECSDLIHGQVAVHEAIESGHFRGEGVTEGGGSVRLSTGGVVEGRPAGESGGILRQAYADLLDFLSTEQDSRVRAFVYAAAVIRHQLYFDGNKRTAKLMASGELMSHGFDAVSVPYARLHEQNLALDELFDTDDATALIRLFADCAR